MKGFKLNYQKRLFLYNIVLFVVPFLLVALFIVHFAITEVDTRTNKAQVAMLEQVSDNLSGVFQQITYFSNIFYWDAKLNSIISDRTEGDLYQQVLDAREVSGLFRINMYAFDQYQYGVTILGTNKKHFTSLYDMDEDSISGLTDQLASQDWYRAASQKGGQIIYLPQYKAEPLAAYDKDAMVFAVREMHNLSSGRPIGAVIISIKSQYLTDIYSKALKTDTQQIMVINEDGIIFHASEPQLMKQDMKASSYYDKLNNYDKGYFLASHEGQKSQVVFVTNPVTGWKIVLYTPVRLLDKNWTFLFSFIIIITILYLCIALFMSYYNAKVISKPVQTLSKAMARLQEGDVTVRTEVLYEDELGQLSRQFNLTAEKIGELMTTLEENEERKRTLEIQALQAQINPHFLYNTLASIRFMLEMDMTDKAKEALLSLVKLLKRTFSGHQKLITLSEEFETVKHYLSLLKLRHDDDFLWNIELEEGIEEYRTPKFILQPLVENCVTHGFHEMETQGMIYLTAKTHGDDIIITVEDNGNGADIAYVNRLLEGNEEQNYMGGFSGIGMKNVHDRIRLFFGNDYGLQAFSREGKGTIILVRIPGIPPDEKVPNKKEC